MYHHVRPPPGMFPFEKAAFLVLAALFGVAGVFHVAAVVSPALASNAPANVARHALFIAINAACALGFATRVRRTSAFAIAFALLVLQQLWSHGRDVIVAARAGAVDIASVGVVIVMPLALWLVVREWQRGRAT